MVPSDRAEERTRMPTTRPTRRLRLALELGLVIAVLPAAHASDTQDISGYLAARLTPAQQQAVLAYRLARSKFEGEHRAYWNRVESKREARRARRMLGQPYTIEDYVASQPPK